MKVYKDKIDIIISWRIGDALLSIPMLMCLNQLNKKYNSKLDIRVITQPFLFKLFSSLGIFHCKSMNITEKIQSHIFPANKTFFLETTSKNFGYHSKESYGLSNPHKKMLKFSNELPFLDSNKMQALLPDKLLNFLLNNYKLPSFSIGLFGVCLELGYSVDQIIDTFKFTPELIDLNKFSACPDYLKNEKYIVFCMEAAYGRSGDSYRCWDEKHYFEIAHKCFENFNLKSVFVGLDKKVSLPEEKYFLDLRGKLNLFQLAQVLKSSICYLGNDTGPLHIANLMKKPSIGIYFREISLTQFNPIFPDSNTQVFKPEEVDEVYYKIKDVLQAG